MDLRVVWLYMLWGRYGKRDRRETAIGGRDIPTIQEVSLTKPSCRFAHIPSLRVDVATHRAPWPLVSDSDIDKVQPPLSQRNPCLFGDVSFDLRSSAYDPDHEKKRKLVTMHLLVTTRATKDGLFLLRNPQMVSSVAEKVGRWPQTPERGWKTHRNVSISGSDSFVVWRPFKPFVPGITL